MVSWMGWLPSIIFLTAFLALQVSGTEYKLNVNEIERDLLAHKDDLFGEEDHWASLSDAQREAWTASNEVVRLSDGMQDLLKRINVIRRSGISVPIAVHIAAPPECFTKEKTDLIAQYAQATRREARNGTELRFDISVAPETLYQRISMHDRSSNPADLIGTLEQEAVKLGAVNVLFVIVNIRGSGTETAASIPFVGSGRTSWITYDIATPMDLNVATLLVAAERAAERVYSPTPLYFPVPLIRQLRIELVAYTPGHGHRALWLHNFVWDEFEAAVRAVAVRGQKVIFSSSQTNAECPSCERAFRDVEKYERDFPNKAAKVFNNNIIPNETWAKGMAATYSKKKVLPNTFRLYVLDTTKLRKSEYLRRLERRMLAVYPGMAFITLRSSDEVAYGKLESQMIKAIVAGVYGIAEPDLYMHPKIARQVSKHTKRPSLILFDIIVRNLVRSVMEKHLSELTEIVEGILYFDVDPAKSLGDHEYSYFAQRVNLMIFKFERAQRILGESSDASSALYLVSSAFHDAKAVRLAFGMTAHCKSFEHFRDPTLRCHFSRLRREALKASQIFESVNPNIRHLGTATMWFAMAAVLTYAMLEYFGRRKMRGKRE